MSGYKVVKHNGVEYDMPDFEAWVTEHYGARADWDLLEVSTWDDLIRGRRVFIPHEIIGDRGENDRTKTDLHQRG